MKPTPMMIKITSSRCGGIVSGIGLEAGTVIIMKKLRRSAVLEALSKEPIQIVSPCLVARISGERSCGSYSAETSNRKQSNIIH
jgi:hypothetical protein